MIIGNGTRNAGPPAPKTDHAARDRATARNRGPRPPEARSLGGPGAGPTTSERLLQQRTPIDRLRGGGDRGADVIERFEHPSPVDTDPSPFAHVPEEPRRAFEPQAFTFSPPFAPKTPDVVGPVSPTVLQGHETADAIIEDFTAAVDTAGTTDGETRQQAVLDAAAHLERIAEIEDPAVRERVLVSVEPALVDLGELIDHLDAGQTETAIASLTRTAESLGSEQATLLAEPIGHGLSVGTRRHPSNADELRDAVQRSVEAGDGAVFGFVLLDVYLDPDSRRSIGDGLAAGLDTLNEDFESALEDRRALDDRVAGYVAEHGGILDEDELNAGVQAVHAESQSVIDDFEAASKKLTGTLDGVSLVADERAAASDDPRAVAWAAADRVKAQLAPLGESESGRAAIADAIVASGEGERNFFTRLGSFGVTLDKTKGVADDVVDVLFDSLAARAATLLERDDATGAAALFRGFENAAPLLGISDREQLEALTETIESADLSTDAGRLRFAEDFAKRAGEVDGRFGTDGDSRLDRAFGVLGVVVGAAALAKILFDNRTPGQRNPEEILRGLVDAAGLPKDFADALAFEKGGKLFDTLAKLAKLGVVFDAVDFVRAVQAGDIPKAGLALTALVGGILGTTSIGGPLGSAIGGVLSVFAVAGTIGLDLYRKGRDEDRAEESLGTFLAGAGFTDEEVELLRDVDPDTHLSVVRIAHQIAARHPDLEPRDVLELLLRPGEHRADEFGGLADVDRYGPVDNRRRLIDDIEALDRTDDGDFTDDSVTEAIVLFERYLGVFVDPSGYTPESAVRDLNDEFARLDLNDDGLVTRTELGTVVAAHGIPEDFIGPPSPEQRAEDELARLPRYLLERDPLFQRLDAVSESRADGRISRDDIAEVSERRGVIETLLTHRTTFDTAGQEAGTGPDGIISIDDLETIRDGDHDEELVAAAAYLLEHEEFWKTLTNAGARESREIDIEVTKASRDESRISVADLAAIRLELGIV